MLGCAWVHHILTGRVMKTLILHLGTPKTGSSTIQASFGSASEALRKQNIIYPAWKPYNHCLNFSVLFQDDPKRSNLYRTLSPISDEAWSKEQRRLKEQWVELFDSFSSGTCVISAENLWRFNVGEVERVVAFVRPWFEEIRAVAYVRKPLALIPSMLEQEIKDLNRAVSMLQLLEGIKRKVQYSCMRHWENCLGEDKLVLRAFEPSTFRNGSLLEDFCHMAEIPIGADFAVDEIRANASIGWEGSAFLYALNRDYPRFESGAFNPARGMVKRRHMLYRMMREIDTRKMQLDLQFSEAEAAALNEEIRFVNRYLPEGGLFPEVTASGQKTRLPESGDIDISYFTELINSFSLQLDEALDQNQRLRDRVDELVGANRKPRFRIKNVEE